MTDIHDEKQVTDASIAEAKEEATVETVRADTAKAETARAGHRRRQTQATKPVEKQNFVLYASADDEPAIFHVYLDPELDPIRGIRDSSGDGLLWRVPANLAERFERHSLFVGGRIIRAE